MLTDEENVNMILIFSVFGWFYDGGSAVIMYKWVSPETAFQSFTSLSVSHFFSTPILLPTQDTHTYWYTLSACWFNWWLLWNITLFWKKLRVEIVRNLHYTLLSQYLCWNHFVLFQYMKYYTICCDFDFKGLIWFDLNL